MQKTIFITGSTDGIGLVAAEMLAAQGHRILLHGRDADKLEKAAHAVSALSKTVESYQADLSRLSEVHALAKAVEKRHQEIHVLINNAGVFKTSQPVTDAGLDIRMVVNTLAPYHLTRELLPLLGAEGRVVNISSAAQAPVDFGVLEGKTRAEDMAAYAQSKLALTMWSNHMAHARKGRGPIFVAVNPGSLLGTKMVREGFGVAGGHVRIGGDIIARAALSEEFAAANGKYFDNDARAFGSPHPHAQDPEKCAAMVREIERVLQENL